MNNILVAGSINVDLTIQTPRVPKLGETVSGFGFSTICGGKGANQAIAVSKSGGSAVFLGCIGDDIYGRMAIENLASAGIDTEKITVCPECPTGVAVITVCGGDNHIILDAGANGAVTPEYIAMQESAFQKAEIVLLQLEIPMNAVEKAAELAKKHGCMVVLNPAPYQPLSTVLLQNVDLLIPNEFEAEQLVGFPVQNREQSVKAIDAMERMGVQAIITLGERGSVYKNEGNICFQPAFHVKAIDTTAAGDTFIGSLCACLCEGRAMAESIRYATAASAVAVGRLGASTSIPNRDEVFLFLKEDEIKACPL